MIALKTSSGQTIRVSEDRVAAWEARGYKRVDQPEPKAPAKKTAASKKAKS